MKHFFLFMTFHEHPPRESTNLSTEIYKTKNGLGSESMKDTFLFKQKPYITGRAMTLYLRASRLLPS